MAEAALRRRTLSENQPVARRATEFEWEQQESRNHSPEPGYRDPKVMIDTATKEILIKDIIFEGTRQIPFDDVQTITRLTKLTIFNCKSWAIEPIHWVSWSRGFFRELGVGGPAHMTCVVVKARRTPFNLKYGFSVDNWDEFCQVVRASMPHVQILTQ